VTSISGVQPGAQVPGAVEILSFGTFFQTEYPGLVTLALTLTGSRATAEEIASDAMVVAYRQWGRVASMDHPAAFVRRICANLSRSTIRRRIAEAKAVLRLGNGSPSGGSDEPFDAEFWAEVRRLPKRQAQAVALHYGCDLSVAEVAQVLGIAEGSIKSHLSRARKTLAQRLGEREESAS
jgi:RNA polymerase sigma-70 factor (ECF subfamily)